MQIYTPVPVFHYACTAHTARVRVTMLAKRYKGIPNLPSRSHFANVDLYRKSKSHSFTRICTYSLHQHQCCHSLQRKHVQPLGLKYKALQALALHAKFVQPTQHYHKQAFPANLQSINRDPRHYTICLPAKRQLLE